MHHVTASSPVRWRKPWDGCNNGCNTLLTIIAAAQKCSSASAQRQSSVSLQNWLVIHVVNQPFCVAWDTCRALQCRRVVAKHAQRRKHARHPSGISAGGSLCRPVASRRAAVRGRSCRRPVYFCLLLICLRLLTNNCRSCQSGHLRRVMAMFYRWPRVGRYIGSVNREADSCPVFITTAASRHDVHV